MSRAFDSVRYSCRHSTDDELKVVLHNDGDALAFVAENKHEGVTVVLDVEQVVDLVTRMRAWLGVNSRKWVDL